MTLPSIDRIDPRDQAVALAARGCLHDVVVAASKVLHANELTESDSAALRWAQEQIEKAASKDVVFAMPPADALAGSGAGITALRRAAQPDGGDPDEALAAIREGLDAALQGARGEAVSEAMSALRTLFSAVSQVALQSEVSAHGESAIAEPSWERLTKTSIS